MQPRARFYQDRPPSPREIATKALRPDGIVFRTSFLEQLNNHAIDMVEQYGLTVTRSLDGGDVLPGFKLSLPDLFARANRRRPKR